MFKKFAADRTGTVAITSAIVAIPLLLAAGMAIDVSNSFRIRSENQNALDAAVLTAIHETSASGARKTLAKAYVGNGGTGNIANMNFTDDATGRSLSASTTLAKKNDFAGIVGQSRTNISVASKAMSKPSLSELKIKPIYAGGTYRKLMRLFDVAANGTPKEILNIKYSTSGTSGTGTMAMTPSSSSFLTIQNPSSLYFTMEIDPTSAYIDASTKLRLATNDPATSHHLFVDRKQLPANTVVNIANYVPCGKTALFEWEDGGNFTKQDFGFEVTGNCKVTPDSPVVLVN